MRREPDRLAAAPFDLLVVGGGIYGAWTAWGAALRGMRVAIIDKNDWASGTSSASTKLIHGGLRYLERYHFRLVRTSLAERRYLLRLAPHLVQPVTFGLPHYRGSRVGRWRLRAGLSLYDAMAGFDPRLAGHGWLDRMSWISRFPFLTADGLAGGFTFADCQVDDARLVLELVASAYAQGAVPVNYAAATDWIRESGRVRGAVVHDRVSDRTLEVRASVVVNAAGPWIHTAGGGGERWPHVRMTKGVHLVMPPLPTSDALLLLAERDGRVFFMIPWYGRTLLGTTDTDYQDAPDHASPDGPDVDYLIDAANHHLAESEWSRGDVISAFAGIRALQADGPRLPSDVSREWTMSETSDGVIVSVGGKYTSARADAVTLVDRAARLAGVAIGSDRTADHPLRGCPSSSFHAWLEDTVAQGRALGMETPCARALAQRHGTRADDLLERVRTDPGLGKRIAAELPFVLAEVAYAFEAEMAVTAEDVLRRRIPLFLLAAPDLDILDRVLDTAAAAAGWPAERRDRERETAFAAWTRLALGKPPQNDANASL